MKRYSLTLAIAALLGATVLFNSCIGSFALTNKVKDWNDNVSNKFVNELIFVALHIIPVYELCLLADGVVLNSIEFWNETNPIARQEGVKKVKGEKGDYLVKTTENGYEITNVDEQNTMLLSYDDINRAWSVSNAEGYTRQLLQFTDDQKAIVYVGGENQTIEVELSHKGLMAYKQAVAASFFALNR